MNVFTGQHWRCRNREQIYGHGPGEEGEGETNWREYHGRMYTNICKIDSQWEFAV